MPRLVILTYLFCAYSDVLAYGDNLAAIRFAHFEVLSNQYVAAASDKPAKGVVREFAPKFLALAAEDPTDLTALRCCEWVITHCGSYQSDHQLCEAEAVCWDMLGKNLSDGACLCCICLDAARYPTPARERFLRELPNEYRQPVEVHGHAFLALADLLEKKWKMAADTRVLDKTAPANWRQYLARVGAVELGQEIAGLYEHVLSHYRDIPYRYRAKNADDSQTLGDVAAKRLGDLKSVRFAGRSSRDSVEKTVQQLNHLSGD